MFFQCDINYFYPAVTDALLMLILNLLRNYCQMSDKDIEISKQARDRFFTIMNACRRREKKMITFSKGDLDM